MRATCLIVTLYFVLMLTACGGGSSVNLPDNSGPVTVEIREYMGEKLSSTSQMRENSIKGPQIIDIDSWRLTIEGLVDSTRVFTYDQLLQRERIKRVVWVHCVEGWSVKVLWEGFRLSALLDEVGIKNEASHVLFYAADGYHNYLTTNFVRVNDIIAATHANGRVLTAARGFPLFVVSQSKYGYKWCKWVERIVLADSPQGAGFYENRGYSNAGNVGDHPYDPDENRIQP